MEIKCPLLCSILCHLWSMLKTIYTFQLCFSITPHWWRGWRQMTTRCCPSWLSHVVLLNCPWSLTAVICCLFHRIAWPHTWEKKERVHCVSVRSGPGKCLGPEKLVFDKKLQMLLYYKLSCCRGTDKTQWWDCGPSSSMHRHSLSPDKRFSADLLCYCRWAVGWGCQVFMCFVTTSGLC